MSDYLNKIAVKPIQLAKEYPEPNVWHKVVPLQSALIELEELRELLRRCYNEVKVAYDEDYDPVAYWKDDLEELIIKELDL